MPANQLAPAISAAAAATAASGNGADLPADARPARGAPALRCLRPLWPALGLSLIAGCHLPGASRSSSGGTSATTLGGALAPSVLAQAAPDNPQSPSATTLEKIIVREYAPPLPTMPSALPWSAPAAASPTPTPSDPSALSPSPYALAAVPLGAPALLRETISEKAATQTGTAQRDTSRELAARLANTRGVMWAGLLLLVGGPIVALRFGWPLNGAIAAATGLLLIVFAQVLPGHEAWFGLGLLLLIPLVCYVYYRGHYDHSSSPPASS